MILLLSEWYSEVGVEFKVSNKILKIIREKLLENIFIPNGLDKEEERYYFNIVITANSHSDELDVRGPTIRKREKMIDYGLWLPYNKIIKASNYLETYLDYLFAAFVKVFDNYKISEKVVLELKNEVVNIVLNSTPLDGGSLS